METVIMGLRLLEIERELYGSGAESALAKYDSVLESLDGRIAEALSTGLERDEYARVSRLKEANLIARKILRLAVKEGVSASSEPQDVNIKQQ
jgi:hypothetical protein